MGELITRIKVVFTQLWANIQSAVSTAEPGQKLLSVLDAILPVLCGVLRVAAVIVAIVVISRCITSLYREKTGREIWGWLTMTDGTRLNLHHWENAVGRGGRADITLHVPTVSRSHAALQRSGDGTWTVTDMGSRTGTVMGGKPIAGKTPIKKGDRFRVGSVSLRFLPVETEPAARGRSGRRRRSDRPQMCRRYLRPRKGHHRLRPCGPRPLEYPR